MITVKHAGPESLRLGVIHANEIDPELIPEGFENELSMLLERRSEDLPDQEDAWRQAVRDILRHGKYKPTGRGKPASEYLLRAAGSQAFPRINSPVDICNYISLLSLLPVSIWDTDRTETDAYVVRLGRENESYVFNSIGQTIDLTDLLVGCTLLDTAGGSEPIVNPVKDSMKTKTSADTRRVAALVYGRLDEGPIRSLQSICDRFSELLAGCGPTARASNTILHPGDTLRI